MSNPTNEDFEEIAELLFQSWYSEDTTSGPEESTFKYGPGGDEDLYGALKRKKKKTKRKRDKSKSKSKSKPSRKKPETKSKKKKQKKKRTKRRRR